MTACPRHTRGSRLLAKDASNAQWFRLPPADCLRGCPTPHKSRLMKRWSTQSVPKHWGPDMAKQFLEKQGCSDIDQLQSPKYKSGRWTVLATPPQHYRSQDKLIYTMGTVDVIIPCGKKPQDHFRKSACPLRNAGSRALKHQSRMLK